MIKELKDIIPNKPIENNPCGFKNCYGVRLPELRKIAKLIAKEKRYDIFEEEHNTFEELTIHAYAIGYLKEDIDVCLKYLKEFIPLVDNWSVSDSLCQNMKFAKENQKEVFEFLHSMKDSENEWEVRVIAVTLLSHFLNEKYIDEVIFIIKELKANTYMSKMGVAWLLATMMAKFPKKTIKLFEEKSLDKWIHNKAIQKSNESFRVDQDYKKQLKLLKR